MNRRSFLHSATGLTAVTLAGCLADAGDGDSPDSTGSPDETPTDESTRSPTDDPTPTVTPSPTPDGPSGVYVQSFRETMVVSGMATDGDYRFALLLAVPHRFWTVTLEERSAVPIEDSDDVHLMVAVWDPESGRVLPDSDLSVELTRDGDLVSQEVIYPMLSQRMGFHYGANFALEGDGTYTARISTGGVSARTTGSFTGRFESGASAAIDFEWSKAVREQLKSESLDAAGSRGALKPMDMGELPQPQAATPENLSGTVLGTARIDDAKLVVTQLTGMAAERFTDGDPYFAVSARTPYNRLVLPAMSVVGQYARADEILFSDDLQPTLDPELGYHYGATVPEQAVSGDEVVVEVPTPPQLARHEGYERAFLQMTADSFTV